MFVPDVQPGDVYKSRKILLKTRDLVDVFSPVYKNDTILNDDEDDMWSLIRHHLNIGYVVVGEFQDLHNAHVLYAQELMEQRRNVVLAWKSDFEQFQETHDALFFLQSSRDNQHGMEKLPVVFQNSLDCPKEE